MLAFIAGTSIFLKSSKDYKLLVIYISVGLVVTFLSCLLAWNCKSNLFLFHAFTLFENIILSSIFVFWIQNLKAKRIIKFCIIGFATFWLFAKIFIENVQRFDNFTLSLNSAILIIISGYAISKILFESRSVLFYNPKFWILSGVLIYYSGCLILFALSNVIYYWSLHNVLNIVYKILITTGFILKWKK